MKKILIYLFVFICFFAAELFSKQNKLAKINYSSYYNRQSLSRILNRYKTRNKFILPVHGKVFYKKLFKGVFIKPYYHNSKIKAAKSGKVLFSGFLKYFGNVVILKHNSGYITIYAYLKKSFVKRGSRIAQGATIGVSYKKHSVYFEIRKHTSCLASRKIAMLILNNG